MATPQRIAMDRYNPEEIEPKWEAIWEKEGLFRAVEEDEGRPRFYKLHIFPYPSGDLHMGHAEAFANEQVVQGRCERCGTPVVRRDLTQWFFKITDYADRLLDDMAQLDWSDRVLTQQRNWIGRSYGAEVSFEIEETGDRIPVFTT